MVSIKRVLENRYDKVPQDQLEAIFFEKKKRYKEMMKVLNPMMTHDFIENTDYPLWVRISHIDDFLECPQCCKEYEEQLKINKGENHENR